MSVSLAHKCVAKYSGRESKHVRRIVQLLFHWDRGQFELYKNKKLWNTSHIATNTHVYTHTHARVIRFRINREDFSESILNLIRNSIHTNDCDGGAPPPCRIRIVREYDSAAGTYTVKGFHCILYSQLNKSGQMIKNARYHFFTSCNLFFR